MVRQTQVPSYLPVQTDLLRQRQKAKLMCPPSSTSSSSSGALLKRAPSNHDLMMREAGVWAQGLDANADGGLDSVDDGLSRVETSQRMEFDAVTQIQAGIK